MNKIAVSNAKEFATKLFRSENDSPLPVSGIFQKFIHFGEDGLPLGPRQSKATRSMGANTSAQNDRYIRCKATWSAIENAHTQCHALPLVWLSSRLRVSGFRQARPRFDCHLLFDFSAHLPPRISICTPCKLYLCWIWLLFSIPCKIYFLVFYQFGGLFSTPSSTLPTYSLKAIKFW